MTSGSRALSAETFQAMSPGGGSVNGFRLPRHVIHQEILTERVWSREVSLTPAHLRDLLHELNQSIVRDQHEGVDQHARALALRDFLESLADDKRIKPERVLVNSPIFKRQRRWLTVGDHHDLLHVLALALQNPLGHPQAFTGIGIVRSHLHASQL